MPTTLVNSCLSLEWTVTRADHDSQIFTNCKLFEVDVVADAGTPQVITEDTPVDIIFVLDESGSVNYKDYCQTTDCYDTAIASAIESVKGLDDEIGLFDTGGKAGWQEFSDFNGDPTDSAEHHSGMATSFKSFSTSMEALTYSKGFSAVGTGMGLASDLLMSSKDAADRLKIMVVLSDGKENQKSDPLAVADRARALGIWVYTAGVTSSADTKMLSDIVGPQAERFLSVGSLAEKIIADRAAAMQVKPGVPCVTEAELTLQLGSGYTPEGMDTSGGDWSLSEDGELVWKLGDLSDTVATLSYTIDACDCDMVGDEIQIFKVASFSSGEGWEPNLDAMKELSAVASNDMCTEGEPSELCFDSICFRNQLAPQFDLGVILKGFAFIRGRLTSDDLRSELIQSLDDIFGFSADDEGGSFTVLSILPARDAGGTSVSEDVLQRKRSLQAFEMDANASLSCNVTNIAEPVTSNLHMEYCACWEGALNQLDCELVAEFEKRYTSGVIAAAQSLDVATQSESMVLLADGLGVLPGDVGIFSVSVFKSPGSSIGNEDVTMHYWDGVDILSRSTAGTDLLGVKGSRSVVIALSTILGIMWLSLAYLVFGRRRILGQGGVAGKGKRGKKGGFSPSSANEDMRNPPLDFIETYDAGELSIGGGQEYCSEGEGSGGEELDCLSADEGSVCFDAGGNPMMESGEDKLSGWGEQELSASGLMRPQSDSSIHTPNPLARKMSAPIDFAEGNPMVEPSPKPWGITDFFTGLLAGREPVPSERYHFDSNNPMKEGEGGDEAGQKAS